MKIAWARQILFILVIGFLSPLFTIKEASAGLITGRDCSLTTGSECDSGWMCVNGTCELDIPCTTDVSCQDLAKGYESLNCSSGWYCNVSGHCSNKERCDNIDNNCNMIAVGDGIDEGCDDDHDNYCDLFMAKLPVVVTTCSATPASSTVGNDCNDADATIYPGACDGLTNSCSASTTEIDSDGDGFLACEDCDDSDPLMHPGPIELERCNGKDDNCDGAITGERDVDGDGQRACAGDCNDNDPAMFQGNPEICDSKDNDCNGTADSGLCDSPADNDTCIEDSGVCVFDSRAGRNVMNCSNNLNDADTDGYSAISATCTAAQGGDCNDSTNTIHPGPIESCEPVGVAQVDSNCNGTSNENTDTDSIGCGNTFNTNDCNNGNGSIYPGAPEKCNGKDDNCNYDPNNLAGTVDEGLSVGSACGVGECRGTIECNLATEVAVCNGGSPTPEICDGLDNDCDGEIDEGVKETFYADLDSDTYGRDGSGSILACRDPDGTPPDGFSDSTDDCNDLNRAVHPNATEICNNIDDNCVGGIDEGSNACGGVCVLTNRPGTSCDAPTGTDFTKNDSDTCVDDSYICNGRNATVCANDGTDVDRDHYSLAGGFTGCNADCNDTDAAINPGMSENPGDPDNADENCNGKIGCYVDADNDGYRPNNTPVSVVVGGTCGASGFAYADEHPTLMDCNDTIAAINPGMAEVCNGQDDDCNGAIDNGFPLLGTSCTNGVGECSNSGTNVCKSDGTGTTCNAVPKAPTAEVCDGRDNDCNGIVPTNEADADGDGVRLCAGDCDDTNPAIVLGTTKPGDSCQMCDAAGSGTWVTKMDGAACDDGYICTSGETCLRGACQTGSTISPNYCFIQTQRMPGVPVIGSLPDGPDSNLLQDLPPATPQFICFPSDINGGTDSPTDGWKNPYSDCQVCDPSRSQSAWSNLPSGFSCQDGDECTSQSRCDAAGSCTNHTYFDFGSGGTMSATTNPCNNWTCTHEFQANRRPIGSDVTLYRGEYVATGFSAVALCDDGQGCTTDTCPDTSCLSPTITCDTSGCTRTCSATNCSYPAITCTDSTACTADSCVATGSDSHTCKNDDITGTCNDGIACTVDGCDAGTGCTATPDNSKCDDGNPCTVDVCDPSVAGGCRHDAGHAGTECRPSAGACDIAESCDGVTKACPADAAPLNPDDGNVCTADSCTASGILNTPLSGQGTLNCGTGACQRSIDKCENGVLQVCTPGTASPEICDGIDNNCDGVVPVSEGDSDGDRVLDCADNCSSVANADQADVNHDGIGDACCGNGAMDTFGASREQCDDGNRDNTDDCDNQCAPIWHCSVFTCTDKFDYGTASNVNGGGQFFILDYNSYTPLADRTDAWRQTTGDHYCSATQFLSPYSDATPDGFNKISESGLGPHCHVTAGDSEIPMSAIDQPDYESAVQAYWIESVTRGTDITITCDPPSDFTGTAVSCGETLHVQACDPAHEVVDCNDNNPCTEDRCDTSDSSAFQCIHPAAAEGTSCNDGNACTQTDTCSNGTCGGSNPVICNASDQCHSAGICDNTTGVCSNPEKANGTSCNDGNACTQTDTCLSGSCGGSNPVICNASDQCHSAGICDNTTGVCTNPAVTDGTSCNDGNACTQTDTCSSGSCSGSNPIICNASDQCHSAGICDNTTGVCSNPEKANGATCDDGNACTQTDTCSNGSCGGSNPVICNASDQCHSAGICDNTTGVCTNPAVTDGTSCDDGNTATVGDVCTSGNCAGTEEQCPAGGSKQTALCISNAEGIICPSGDSSTEVTGFKEAKNFDTDDEGNLIFSEGDKIWKINSLTGARERVAPDTTFTDILDIAVTGDGIYAVTSEKIYLINDSTVAEKYVGDGYVGAANKGDTLYLIKADGKLFRKDDVIISMLDVDDNPEDVYRDMDITGDNLIVLMGNKLFSVDTKATAASVKSVPTDSNVEFMAVESTEIYYTGTDSVIHQIGKPSPGTMGEGPVGLVSWSSCPFTVCEKHTEVCDGLDNDCDGNVDEEVKNACGGCGPAPEEKCDSIDNNCNGLYDEGCDCNGTEERACGIGECKGVEICTAKGTWGDECDYTHPGSHGPQPEICDNLDNDCDGQTDEDACVVSVEPGSGPGGTPGTNPGIEGGNPVIIGTGEPAPEGQEAGGDTGGEAGSSAAGGGMKLVGGGSLGCALNPKAGAPSATWILLLSWLGILLIPKRLARR